MIFAMAAFLYPRLDDVIALLYTHLDDFVHGLSRIWRDFNVYMGAFTTEYFIDYLSRAWTTIFFYAAEFTKGIVNSVASLASTVVKATILPMKRRWERVPKTCCGCSPGAAPLQKSAAPVASTSPRCLPRAVAAT